MSFGVQFYMEAAFVPCQFCTSTEWHAGIVGCLVSVRDGV